MNIGAANRSAINLYQYIVMTNTRRLNLFQPDTAFGLGFYQGFHQSITPSSRPTAVKASIA